MIRSIEDVDLESRRVLVRADLDCRVEGGEVTDASRIREALATLRHALNRRARLVVMGHLGRPQGRRLERFSLEPVGAALARLLDTEVVLADDCVGDGAHKVVSDLYGGRIALLENLGFHAGEEANDGRFARALADMADVYVGEAFRVMHRSFASVATVPRLVRDRCAGLRTGSEMESLGALLGEVKRPFVAVIGGTVGPEKIAFVRHLLGRVDELLVGGAVANTLLAAQGREMGRSRVEERSLLHARSILKDARRRSVRIALPVDLVTSGEAGPERTAVREVGDVRPDETARDLGPGTLALFAARMERAGTLLWHGPVGSCERPPFHEGTVRLAEAAGRCLCYKVVGGEDTARAIRSHGLAARFDHVSTGGEASLRLLEGEPLEGAKALEVTP